MALTIPKKEISITVIFVVLLLGFFIKDTYNKAVTLDEGVKKQFAQIDTELGRRYDLIPVLSTIADKYAKHELDSIKAIADGRKQYTLAPTVEGKLEVMKSIESSLSRLLVIFERYPDLLADRVYLRVMATMEDTANRITDSQQQYNEKVFLLNSYKRSVEGTIPCIIARVSNASYLDFTAKQKESK